MIRHVWSDDRHKNASFDNHFSLGVFRSSTSRLNLGTPCEYQPVTGEPLPVHIGRKNDKAGLRYADDFVVLCESSDRGKAPLSTPIGLICLGVKRSITIKLQNATFLHA